MDTSARAQNSDPLSISTIVEYLTITGNVTSTGELHLDGRINGDVHCVSLVLRETAQLEGSVVAEHVMVRGRLIGSVRALSMMLQSQAQPLSQQPLCGTHFDGESRPSADPLSTSPEVPTVEAQPNHNGRLNAVNQRESVKGFIRLLPESLSV